MTFLPMARRDAANGVPARLGLGRGDRGRDVPPAAGAQEAHAATPRRAAGGEAQGEARCEAVRPRGGRGRLDPWGRHVQVLGAPNGQRALKHFDITRVYMTIPARALLGCVN